MTAGKPSGNFTISELRRLGASRLSKSGSTNGDAAIDADVLLMHSLALSRTELYTRAKDTVRAEDAARFWHLLERREKHEPIAYIIGRKEFFSLEFTVSPDVLIPRPETEYLVERGLDLACECPSIVYDIGAGSGAVIIAIAVGCRDSQIAPQLIGSDISRPALKIAEENARKHGVSDCILFYECSLLDHLPSSSGEKREVILANLPYIPTGRKLLPDVAEYEPHAALFSGRDGTDLIKKFLAQLLELKRKDTVAILEFDSEQVDCLIRLVENFGFNNYRIIKDLSGRFRYLEIWTKK